MTNTKYEKLDALILSKIGVAPIKFASIHSGDIEDESNRIVSEQGPHSLYGFTDPWRIVDRRLQSLRKAGKIRSTPKGWVRTAPQKP
ncbi:hypothetical protein [Burkholderia mayonis]|uniref:Uncharacterized protein n=1 Tax=Burkholderia mayonis TaxID=1385591 RepID=A0A1B4G358_9BURK|nr:hypothetical protein [Burkholderia mayonis]AOJ10367.1 hypothetical protein WS71_24475 [Burkholderia mayonis]KVE53653.1 hypothetical protein WS71_06305 [Burkholderia mayonis]